MIILLSLAPYPAQQQAADQECFSRMRAGHRMRPCKVGSGMGLHAQSAHSLAPTAAVVLSPTTALSAPVAAK